MGTHKRKTVAPETAVPDQAAMIALLLMRCEELGLATSSLDKKLPGVTSEWLHNIKVGRQGTTDLSSLFPLIDGLGLEVVVRKKQAVARSKKASGSQVAQALRKQKAVALSASEKAEIAQVMADVSEVASSELPPELVEARKMAAQFSG